MKIPSKGQYALCALFAVSVWEKDGPVSVSRVARELDISFSYLEQLFAKLRRAGLVQGMRGAGGGYRLARPAEEITVMDVLRAVEAVDAPPAGQQSDYLPESLWAALSEDLARFLEEMTLADVLRRAEDLDDLPS